MAEIKWPPASERHLIGKSISRIDGPDKSSGRAKYSYDMNRPRMLFTRLVTSPHAHAKITAIDTAAIQALPGVHGVYTFVPAGQEVNWEGKEVLAIAAESEQLAEDAARAAQAHVQYQALPFFVTDTDPAQAQKAGADRIRSLAQQKTGDPEQAFQQAEVTSEGTYGLPVITHCCMESHGSVAEWNGDKLNAWISTQSVSELSGEYAQALNIPASNVNVDCQAVGGGFGSKFAVDTWGIAAAALARQTGRPVKLMLQRDSELKVAGSRPSLYGRIRIGAKRDGTLVAWDSQTWGTGGMGTAGVPRLPYIFNIPNRTTQHTVVFTNIGPSRAWRAPNHPQMCLLTMAALDDMAAKLGMDPLDLFIKNIALTGQRADLYKEELLKAAELIDWNKNWHPRGDKTPGNIKRGLGLSIHTWNGAGHASNCRVTIHPDSSVEVALGSQDMGTGTRTVIGIVAAETLGLPLDAVQVEIGDNKYPPDGASGGSTTVGGVSSSTRVSATNALNELLAKVAPSFNTTPDKLEAVGARIQVIGDPSQSISWKQACARLGTTPIVAMGQRNSSLISGGVGGAQMAQVSVDIETGIVQMEKIVAVQDCGLIIDLKTSESQVYGACIMGVGYSLYEEKIMDQQIGKCLNPNMEFYKLSGIGDFGDIVVHMMTDPAVENRGVIGLGEPPTVSPGAAINNAVANAIGVRVPQLPMTPDRVLAALGKGA